MSSCPVLTVAITAMIINVEPITVGVGSGMSRRSALITAKMNIPIVFKLRDINSGWAVPLKKAGRIEAATKSSPRRVAATEAIADSKVCQRWTADAKSCSTEPSLP
jgi:hypothetical protein